MQTLNSEEINCVSGGHEVEGSVDHDDKGFWYKVGKFFAEQANANDAITKQYGNTNRNHI
ncbi:hypothetical protein [Glaciecola petra]|uniref:Bacteriocin n=1 Tax=Glaciecola petra TaxID=3075602 RepID=A0ABU2ZWF0_9ALTE|nr:hypothetical protein [Aestuariibacter sp. P117]MDT0595747.1 hypothetical protein [Aestuariibacter sp. P117]